MVYFTVLDEDQEVQSEFKAFNKLLRQLNGAVRVGVFRLDPSSADFQSQAKKYKVGSLSSSKPILRFYPNRETGKDKDYGSFEIFFDKGKKDIESLIEEIHGGF